MNVVMKAMRAAQSPDVEDHYIDMANYAVMAFDAHKRKLGTRRWASMYGGRRQGRRTLVEAAFTPWPEHEAKFKYPTAQASLMLDGDCVRWRVETGNRTLLGPSFRHAEDAMSHLNQLTQMLGCEVTWGKEAACGPK